MKHRFKRAQNWYFPIVGLFLELHLSQSRLRFFKFKAPQKTPRGFSQLQSFWFSCFREFLPQSPLQRAFAGLYKNLTCDTERLEINLISPLPSFSSSRNPQQQSVSLIARITIRSTEKMHTLWANASPKWRALNRWTLAAKQMIRIWLISR